MIAPVWSRLRLLVHARLLPVGWQVMPLQKTWEERQWAIVGTLFDRVIPRVGQAECTLLADSGLVGMPLVQLCQTRHWHYLLRLSSQLTGLPQGGKQAGRWHAMNELVRGAVGVPWKVLAFLFAGSSLGTSWGCAGMPSAGVRGCGAERKPALAHVSCAGR